MELPLEHKPIIYTWPEYCPSCQNPMAVHQMRLELQALINNLSITDVAYLVFTKPCCRRFILAGIQRNIHNINKNIFRTERCKNVPIKSSIVIYSKDLNEYIDYEKVHTETVTCVKKKY